MGKKMSRTTHFRASLELAQSRLTYTVWTWESGKKSQFWRRAGSSFFAEAGDRCATRSERRGMASETAWRPYRL